jgi:arginase
MSHAPATLSVYPQRTAAVLPATGGSRLQLLGAASGSGGRDAIGNALAPHYARDALARLLPALPWRHTAVEAAGTESGDDAIGQLAALGRDLARHAGAAVAAGAVPVVVGGDHACAVGTWSGVAAALRAQGPLGLLWVDAHMDSHTPSTSPSGNVHGMPLAALLGYGDPRLTQLADAAPKLAAATTVLFGIRSYEPGEAALLKRLGVRIYFMGEIERRGLATCFDEALATVARAPAGYGITFDLDALDPQDAPATCCHEPGGLRLAPMVDALARLGEPERLRAAEFVELNPLLPGAAQTIQAMAALIGALHHALERAAAPLPLAA